MLRHRPPGFVGMIKKIYCIFTGVPAQKTKYSFG